MKTVHWNTGSSSLNVVQVWPKFKISTEYVPEYNEIVCKQSGRYELVFSNKDGLIWSKKVQYSYLVDVPPS